MKIFRQILPVLGIIALTAWSANASDRLLNSLQPRGAVSDFANVIPAAQERELSSMITELKQKTGVEFAVVTVSSMDGGQIDDFTNRLFERWGVGQKGKDNGLMFLAAMKERKMRIEVGYGLEGAIPDATAGRIRRDVITPYFKAGNPGKGIVLGISQLAQKAAAEYGVQLTGTARYTSYPSARRSDKPRGNPIFFILFLIFFIPFAIRHPFLAMLLLSGGRGGGYRSGGFGGGGGGFGGGMSGGGGSSGGW